MWLWIDPEGSHFWPARSIVEAVQFRIHGHRVFADTPLRQLDWMLRAYLHEPRMGHEHMTTIGLEQYCDPTQLTLLNLVALPIVGENGNYPACHQQQREAVVGNKK